MATEDNQPPDSRLEAFRKELEQLKLAILLEIWDTILERFQKTNVSLQERGLSLNSAMHLLKSLLEFVKRQHSEFDSYEEKGKDKSVEKEYKQSSIRSKKIAYEVLHMQFTHSLTY